jgi:hypothetical protein
MIRTDESGALVFIDNTFPITCQYMKSSKEKVARYFGALSLVAVAYLGVACNRSAVDREVESIETPTVLAIAALGLIDEAPTPTVTMTVTPTPTPTEISTLAPMVSEIEPTRNWSSEAGSWLDLAKDYSIGSTERREYLWNTAYSILRLEDPGEKDLETAREMASLFDLEAPEMNMGRFYDGGAWTREAVVEAVTVQAGINEEDIVEVRLEKFTDGDVVSWYDANGNLVNSAQTDLTGLPRIVIVLDDGTEISMAPFCANAVPATVTPRPGTTATSVPTPDRPQSPTPKPTDTATPRGETSTVTVTPRRETPTSTSTPRPTETATLVETMTSQPEEPTMTPANTPPGTPTPRPTVTNTLKPENPPETPFSTPTSPAATNTPSLP